ncbi:MAG: PDZ domain-containing protein [Planctomycetes bacterium]|nr:PDZ domain-containing protein [Planctomycetota bacterium]
MRVDQVITLVWAGNLALLGGTGWVGWKFWEQKKASREVPQTEWPDSGDVLPPMDRWPGPVEAFQVVWKTPLDGLVPPPPKAADTSKPTVESIEQRFRNRIKIVNAVVATNAVATILKIQDGGQDTVLALGQILDNWQLMSVEIDKSKSQVRAGFANPNYDQGLLYIEQVIAELKDPATPGATPLVKEFGGPVSSGEAALRPDDPQAFLNPATGEWDVPERETTWWEVNGTGEILEKTKFVSRPGGLEVASLPPRGPLSNTRGVTTGDMIVSINDVAVKSLDELFAYFRGEGKTQTRFVVVIERDGARRTQTYNVVRRRTMVSRAPASSASDATIQRR